MAGALRIDFAGAQQIAEAVKTASDENDAATKTLASKADPSAVWDGAAANSYRNAFDDWQRAQAQLNEALRVLGQNVNVLITRFQEIDDGANF